MIRTPAIGTTFPKMPGETEVPLDNNSLLATDDGNNERLPYYTVSDFRFITLSTISFSMYLIYWMYKNWSIIRSNYNLQISPIWRTVFSHFFIFSFNFTIRKDMASHNIKMGWNPVAVGILYIAVSLLCYLPIPYLLLTTLCCLPLISVNSSMRKLNLDNRLMEITAGKLNWWKKLIIVTCYILYFLAVVGSFLPAQKN
jgi:hypothetical protein